MLLSLGKFQIWFNVDEGCRNSVFKKRTREKNFSLGLRLIRPKFCYEKGVKEIYVLHIFPKGRRVMMLLFFEIKFSLCFEEFDNRIVVGSLKKLCFSGLSG